MANQSEILYRELMEEDYPALEKLIIDTWRFDKLFNNPTDTSYLAKLYLKNCLQNNTYAKVAVSEGTVVGAIMGRNNSSAKKPSLNEALSWVGDAAKLRLSKSGRQVCELFKDFEELSEELLAQCRQIFDGELDFFAVDPDFRGLDIGKNLLQTFISYLVSEGAHTLYVFTDSTYNSTFYEENGFIKIGEKTKDLQPLIDASLSMCIYSYEF